MRGGCRSRSSIGNFEMPVAVMRIFTKLAVMLRNIPAMQFVFAKFAALLRSDKGNGESLISKFLGEAPGVTGNTVDQHVATLKSSGDFAVAGPKSNDQSEREKLIRRRWLETGIKMWNPVPRTGRYEVQASKWGDASAHQLRRRFGRVRGVAKMRKIAPYVLG